MTAANKTLITNGRVKVLPVLTAEEMLHKEADSTAEIAKTRRLLVTQADWKR